MRLISGKEVAEHITAELRTKVEMFEANNERLPKLVIIRVGEKPDDFSYQKGAVKRMDMIGILHQEIHFAENISKEEFDFDIIRQVEGVLSSR